MLNDLIISGWVFVTLVLLCLLMTYKYSCAKLPIFWQIFLLGVTMSIMLTLSIVAIGPKKSNDIQKVEIVNPAPQHQGDKNAK